MKEKCMKNLFFHSQYDHRLESFKAKLFLDHIYSLSSPNLLDDSDEVGDMNIMDYILNNLEVDQLNKIENMIDNERLYDKEINPMLRDRFALRSSSKGDLDPNKHKSEVVSVDQLFQIFKEGMREGPNVPLDLERK